MLLSDQKLRELVLAAEAILADPDKLKALGGIDRAAIRRTEISRLTNLRRATDEQCDHLEIVRRYIEERTCIPPPRQEDEGSASRQRTARTDLPDLWKLACDKLTMAELAKCSPKLADSALPSPAPSVFAPFPATPTTPKETTMSIIKVETRVFINDTQSDKFTDSQLFAIIQQQEAKIAELDKIENKPQALAKEIQDRKDGIAALVKFMDSKA